MTPLDLLKTELFEKVTILPRTLLSDEIRELEQEIINTDNPIHKILVFPLPLPWWKGDLRTVSHVVRSWSWEREGDIIYLVEFPDDTPSEVSSRMIPDLNSRADIVGRFYQARDRKTYYLNSQTIFCKGDMDKGRPINILTAKAAREAAKHLIGYSLAGVVRDLSLALHLCSTDAKHFEGYLDVGY